MADFSISSQAITPGSAIVGLAGDIGEECFDSLEDEFSKLLDSGVSGIVLDLSGVEAVSSACIGAILDMSRLLAARDGKLVAAAAKPKILGTMELLGLQDTLTLADTVDGAKKLISNL